MEFAEFTALAQILLLSEAAVRDRWKIVVDLPQTTTSDPPDASRLLQRRLSCLRFLRATGFTAAISLPHIPGSPVTVFPRHAADGEQVRPSAQDDSPLWAELPAWNKPDSDIRQNYEIRQVLPFRWIAPGKGDELFHSKEIIQVIRGLRDIGLNERDAKLLANNVVYELVENVALHAALGSSVNQPHALVGALVVDKRLLRVLAVLRSELSGTDETLLDPSETAIQLLVADSGRGLVRHLEPHAALPAGDGSRSSAEEVTLWALERWSTSADPSGALHGTRGLWRVREAIRSYRGALLIHTADALAGYTFTSGEKPLYGRTTWSGPGTLVEAYIVPRSLEPESTVAAPSDQERIQFRWIRLEHRDLNGLTSPANRPKSERLILTADGGRTHDITHERLVAILAAAGVLSTDNAVAVLIAGADPVAVDAALDAVQHPPPGVISPVNTDAPFLLLDGTRRSIWCGSNAQTREWLRQLEDGPLTGNPDVSSMAARYPFLVQANGQTARLLLHPAAVMSHLEDEVYTRLRDVLRHEGEGVGAGPVRTPSLHLANHWIESDRLVENAVGMGVSALLLAHLLVTALPRLQPNTRIVQIGPIVRDLSMMIAESVPLPDAVYELPDDLPALRLLTPLPPRTPCVLCCDVLLSTNRTVKAMRQLLASDAMPIAVMAIVDGRRERGPLTVRGVEIPVIALTEFSSETVDAEDSSIVDIDPVFRVPTAQRELYSPRYALAEAEFLEQCLQLPDIAGLGHVARPLHRHFSAYFNAASIVDTPSAIRELIAEEMVGTIRDWADRGVEAPDLKMFYVGASRDYAAKLAGLVASRLNAGVLENDGLEPREIPRAISGQTYAFPDTLPEPPVDRDVILVDWGSFDATTILQIIRLAAEGGARRIIVLVLLSQMGLHEERALTMTRAVNDPSRSNAVPVEIRFITSLSITPMLPGDCSLCELVGEMNTSLRELSMPHEVATHVSALTDVLGPKSREIVVRSGLDVFGSPITTEDVFEFIRLRGQLIVARRDTGAANQFALRLADLEVPNDGSISALIRLLAAERRWLAQLPLSLTECLAHVSRLALEVVVASQYHERLRLQALVVLTVSGPEELISSLYGIWRSAVDNPVLIHQTLYELWTTLHHHLRHSRKAQQALRRAVVRCIAISSDEYADPQFGKTAQRLLSRLRDSIDVTSDLEPPSTPMDAWAFLRSNYLAQLYRHTEAETAAINLLILFDSPPVGTDTFDDRTWETAQLLWHQVSSFIGTRVLPAMPQLGEIMTSAFARRYFSEHTGADVPDLTAVQTSASLHAVETKLHELRGEKADGEGFRTAWQAVYDDVTRWYDAVLAPGARDTPGAVLARFVDACPAHVGSVLDESAASLSVRIILDSERNLDTFVFCHTDLLREVLQHIFEVLQQDVGESDDGVSQPVRVRIRHTARAMRLHFRTTGMPDTDPRASTTDRLHGLLADFEASLEYLNVGSSGQPEMIVNLCRWAPQVVEDGPE
ncbi:phosphoribosyltransferase [Paractinoplanes brasiliensis]|uniref:phosphoribosyltransferase n=1 Tax=Paractinoplanes brasiliensis TaxID=52695 RepID=UPI001061481F|nr:phosphoribosyltransferase [Actinoplanes brasiliensis]